MGLLTCRASSPLSRARSKVTKSKTSLTTTRTTKKLVSAYHKTAPEVVRQLAHTSSADIFSLGATVWVLLTGGFRGSARQAPERGVYPGFPGRRE